MPLWKIFHNGKSFLASRIGSQADFAPADALDRNVYESKLDSYWQSLASCLKKSFDEESRLTQLQRLSAERDILPEADSWADPSLSVNGGGTSSLVQRILNKSGLDESLIEVKLLGELNKIMFPDAKFSNIRVQLVGEGDGEKWEIFLQEEGKPRFPLSATGSGLKTVILVLLNLLVVNPYAQGSKIYLFEELENNLHPSLQRRLFDYLYEFSKRTGARMVLTSHSQTAINAIFGKEGALIYHVSKKIGGASVISRSLSTESNKEILDDLGIKASDLFQTNGIIWVEGPSDRIYIKAWMKAAGATDLKEGLHYQFLYYGGRLLSHYTAEATAEKINVMFTNVNAAIVMDSDIRAEGKDINATKKRVRKEFNSRGLFYWITDGKEIENYLSVSSLKRAFGDKAPDRQVGRYELFPGYIAKTTRQFERSKVEFSKEVAPSIRSDDLDVLDLRKTVDKLCAVIRGWNE